MDRKIIKMNEYLVKESHESLVISLRSSAGVVQWQNPAYTETGEHIEARLCIRSHGVVIVASETFCESLHQVKSHEKIKHTVVA